MQIEHHPIEALIPYARNSRTHSEEQIAQIAASIREFGFTNPVLIDSDGGIIAGHGRVMGARKLGMEQVPCIRLAHLTEAQRRAYVIADNKLGENSGWDGALLIAELHDLDDIFDLSLIGFSEADLFEMKTQNADLPNYGGDNRKNLGKHKTPTVKMVVRVSDCQIVEEAIAATGIKNRGAAMLEIFRGYHEQAKRQLDDFA